MKVTCWMIVCALAVASVAGAAEFSVKPTATAEGENAVIKFAVDAACDVAVAVIDKDGKVVRHLAAGVLGDKAPAPLKAGALEQAVTFDGKDDAGQAAVGGPFRVRVSAGMEPQFDGFLLYNPAASGPVTALAVGPKGNVYLFHKDPTANWNMGGEKIKIITRDGKHVRAVTPFPADAPPENVKALGVFHTAGDLVPRIYSIQQLGVYPDPKGTGGSSRPAHSSPVVNSRGRAH